MRYSIFIPYVAFFFRLLFPSAVTGLIFIYISSVFFFLGKAKINIYLLSLVLFLSFLTLSSGNHGTGFFPLAVSLLPVVLFCVLMSCRFHSGFIKSFQNLFLICSFVVALIAIFQFLFSPNLFGLVNYKLATYDLWLTSSFRVTSFFGSPQNLGLLLGASLFFRPCNDKFSFWYYLVIVLAGVLTLSSMFGLMLFGALFRWFLKKYSGFKLALFVIFIAVFSMYSIHFLDFRNTALESFSFVEISELDRRFQMGQDVGFSELNFFGNGFGIATQTLIDQNYIKGQTFEIESALLGKFIEGGFFLLSLLILALGIPIYRAWSNIAERKWLIPRLFLLANALVVPAFMSIGAFLIALPLCVSTHDKKI